MTDRPAGTPDPDATDPDVDALEAAEADAIEAAAPAEEAVEPDGDDSSMPRRSPSQTTLTASLTPRTRAPVDEDAEPTTRPEPDDYDAAVREVAGEDVAPAAAAAAAGAATIPTKKRGAQPAPTHVPTPSEKAVHVREDVSKVFVIAAVAVFVAILLNGLLFGTGGLFTPIATPSPSPSAAPSASASAGASASASLGAGIGQPVGFGVRVGPRVHGSVGIGFGAGLRRALGLAQPVGRSPAYPALMGTEEGATDITARQRATMVDEQLRARGIRDERVLEAMTAIPREWFIGERYRRRAYADEAVPIDAGQTISQP